MLPENPLEQKVSDYIEAAKDNKGVDVTALMLNALDSQSQNRLSDRAKKWAYLISLGLPPLGLFFAAWFYFSDKDVVRHKLVQMIIKAYETHTKKTEM